MLRALALLALLCSTAALAGDVSPETAAKVMRERARALEEVNKKHGNKKPSELSGDERRQVIKDQDEATAKVLEKHGVDAKDLARFEARASQEDRAAAAAQAAALDAREADDKKAAEGKQGKSVETSNGIVIERGIDPKDLPPDGRPPKKGARR